MNQVFDKILLVARIKETALFLDIHPLKCNEAFILYDKKKFSSLSYLLI